MITRISSINLTEYDYHLPDEKIPLYPTDKRDGSKLLVYKNAEIIDERFQNIARLIPEKSLIVVNNTKVIHARINFKRKTGANIEIFCLEPAKPSDYESVFNVTENCEWKCFVGNLKKWKDEKLYKSLIINNEVVELTAELLEKGETSHRVKFAWNKPMLSFRDILDAFGVIPIPPYLNRKSEETDLIRYQTVYSKLPGSVAAPTAGLHFTKELFDRMYEFGIIREEVTLHVGAGTFKPVQTDDITQHEMHTEHFIITKNTINKLIEHLGSITAVGTTSARALESIYWMGAGLINSGNLALEIEQWEPYEKDSKIETLDALNSLLKFMHKHNLDLLTAATRIFIIPGYRFRIIDRLLTNFHQPGSTLLLMVSAFIGEDWKKVYHHAIYNEYRFLSYGDSSLLFGNKKD
jgi:S-adenosylmethionine:tRNA ribosyltransferase-isomerase